MNTNLDKETVEGFGKEWSTYDQSGLTDEDREKMFAGYFAVFPWDALPRDGGEGADVGCGSGRWAAMVADRVRRLHCVDAAAEALEVARRSLAGRNNVEFHNAPIHAMDIPDGSLDFAYSLGVVHHVPDTARAIRDIARKLKPGAPLLVYIYYRFDNRPLWFKYLWATSNLGRMIISRLPFRVRLGLTRLIAALVYWPLARTGALLDRLGSCPRSWPLYCYRDKSFYHMRTDALDRFGTKLERRFTKDEITAMLKAADLERIVFSDIEPFWCAVGFRKQV